MAPTGPKKGGAPTGPRNSRNTSSGNGKPSSRGGINKRRDRTGIKVDRDGDLNMDAPATTTGASNNTKQRKNASTGPAPRASTRPTKPTAKVQQIVQRALGNGEGARSLRSGRKGEPPQVVTLKVEGLKSSRAANNEGGGLKELLAFLERKAQTVAHTTRQIRIKKSQMNGDFVYITATKEDADDILKVNGFQFAHATLTITEASEGIPAPGSRLSSTALEVKDQLRNILSLRYDVGQKFLNLSALGEDKGLMEIGFFKSDSSPEKLFMALMSICNGLFKTAQEKRDAITSISLAGNNIDDVQQIMSLTDTFPDLINLDMSRNHFKDIKGLQKWRSRLQKCENLLLNDNPIEAAVPNYRDELTRWFPKLQNLSGLTVRTPQQVQAEEAARKVKPIPQSGPDFRDVNGIGEGFMLEFLQLYDHDRHNLAAKYYDDHSTFSVSVNMRPSQAPDVSQPSWASYIKLSRNQVKITTTNARFQRLFTGTNQVQSVWQQLPPTRHPDLASHFDKYIIDCHPITGLTAASALQPHVPEGIVLTVHGEVEDQEPHTAKTAKRSFSRTFVLGPGAPGRHPIRVVSDMLALKAYHPLTTTSPQPAANTSEAMQKQQMVIQLCEQTGMTSEYSLFCLEGADWNYDQALVSFNEKRAQLPPQAFAASN
ncbi:hypothetical protein F5Y15DRAFT_376190 [Xylariaceae sp. FL0016]|nr:hypothetical protein F5Y15DRAFT_376190 [Xylariaceae sp. FL0016]